MNYVIVDMEFNNLEGIGESYDDFYSGEEVLNNIIKLCPNEIIEIGAIKLDKYLRELDRFKIYIKPTIYPFLNPVIKKMTGITEEDLSLGVAFSEAIDKLKDFIEEDSVVCTWAKDDIIALIKNSIYHGYERINWIKAYFDIQEYCSSVLALKRPISLKKALRRFNIKIDEEKLHDALMDSIYTGEVLKHIYNYRVINKNIVKDIDKMPKATIKIDEEVKLKERIEYKCPICGEELEIQSSLKQYKDGIIGIAYCEKCDRKISHKIMRLQDLVGHKTYKTKVKILNDSAYKYFLERLEGKN